MNSAALTKLRALAVRSYGPVGVDIGAHSVKAVQVRRSGGDVRIAAAATFARTANDSTASIAARLRNVLGRQDFHGRQIVLAAPTKKLQSDLLELPPRSSGAPLETLARAELGRSAAMASAPFEVAMWDLPTPGRSNTATSVLAVALRHSDAEDLQDQFAREGLNVTAIDAAACAFSRACTGFPTEGMTAVVDLGWDAFRLVMVGHGVVTYQRVLSDSGIGALHKEIASRLGIADDVAQYAVSSIGLAGVGEAGDVNGIDPGEAARVRAIIGRNIEMLVEELKASFAFASHRFSDLPLKRIVMGGGGAAIGGVAAAVSKRIGVPAERWDTTKLGGTATDPSMMLAGGLALYQGD